MKIVLYILTIAITAFGANNPYGNARIFENTPYVIVSNQKFISSLYKQVALTKNNIKSKIDPVSIDAENVNIVKNMTLGYRTMGGNVKLYPIITSEEGYQSIFGFWPGKEIVCEVLTSDNHQVFLNIDQIFLYQEQNLDLLIVRCKPISAEDTEIIRSSRDKSIVCLGHFYKQYSDYYQPMDKSIPQPIKDNSSNNGQNVVLNDFFIPSEYGLETNVTYILSLFALDISGNKSEVQTYIRIN